MEVGTPKPQRSLMDCYLDRLQEFRARLAEEESKLTRMANVLYGPIPSAVGTATKEKPDSATEQLDDALEDIDSELTNLSNTINRFNNFV